MTPKASLYPVWCSKPEQRFFPLTPNYQHRIFARGSQKPGALPVSCWLEALHPDRNPPCTCTTLPGHRTGTFNGITAHQRIRGVQSPNWSLLFSTQFTTTYGTLPKSLSTSGTLPREHLGTSSDCNFLADCRLEVQVHSLLGGMRGPIRSIVVIGRSRSTTNRICRTTSNGRYTATAASSENTLMDPSHIPVTFEACSLY